jgi:hypothetical protein
MFMPRVADPDPHGSALFELLDPDPEGRLRHAKIEKSNEFSCFEELLVLSEGLCVPNGGLGISKLHFCQRKIIFLFNCKFF